MTCGAPPGSCSCPLCCPGKYAINAAFQEPPPRGPRGEWGDVFNEFDKRKESKMTHEEAAELFHSMQNAAPSRMLDNEARADGGYWRGVVVGLLYRSVPELCEAIASLRSPPHVADQPQDEVDKRIGELDANSGEQSEYDRMPERPAGGK